MPQMIGPKLRLESVRGSALRARHYTRVRDNHVERLASGYQPAGRRAHALERREVHLDQLDAARFLPHRIGERAARLCQIASGADRGRAMRDESTNRFDSQTGRDAGYQYPFSREIDALEHFVSRRFRSECLCHTLSPDWPTASRCLAPARKGSAKIGRREDCRKMALRVKFRPRERIAQAPESTRRGELHVICTSAKGCASSPRTRWWSGADLNRREPSFR